MKNFLSMDLLLDVVRGAASTAAAKFTSGLGDSRGSHDQKSAYGEEGNFNLYLFAQSWAPRFCCTNYNQCKKEHMEGVEDLSVHGLWPAFLEADSQGRTYPQYCKALSHVKGLHGRLRHEYEKHGTCTTLSPDAYSNEEIKLSEYPSVTYLRDLFNEHSGEAIEVSKIHEEVGGSKFVALMSNAQCQLQEVTTCWSKDSTTGGVGEPMECPLHVLGSSRNNALLQGCRKVYLDPVAMDTEDTPSQESRCTTISKDMVKAMKARQ